MNLVSDQILFKEGVRQILSVAEGFQANDFRQRRLQTNTIQRTNIQANAILSNEETSRPNAMKRRRFQAAYYRTK